MTQTIDTYRLTGIDDHEARLLFRMVNGKVFKRYTDDMPEWTDAILSEE